MKKKLLMLLLMAYALSASNTFAQEKIKQQAKFDTAPEPERRKWEVGLDVFNLVGTFREENVNGIINNQGYIVVRRYSMNKINKSALEFKFGIFNSNTNIIDSFNNELNSKAHNYNFGLGYEFQKQEGRFMLFYGPRITTAFAINSTTPKVVNYTSANSNYTVFQSKGMSFSAGAFLGARFFFNSHLSISVSSNINLSYGKSKANTKLFDSISNNFLQEGNSSRSDLEINGGFSMAQIGYHF